MEPLGCVRLRRTAAPHAFTFVEAHVPLAAIGVGATQIISTNHGTIDIGAIHAPNAHFSLGGGGTEVYDFVGSCVTRSRCPERPP